MRHGRKRACLIGVCLLLSLAAVFAETALAAIWGEMDFDRGGDGGAWPHAVDADWPARSTWVSFCREPLMDGEWHSGHWAPPNEDIYHELVYRLVELRVGWPARCFQYERTLVCPDLSAKGWIMSEPDSLWRGGLKTPPWMPAPEEPLDEAPCIRRIPIRPVWSGLTINVALHAVLLMTLFRGPAQLRRWRRRRRGLCVTCGYDIRSLTTCPECASPSEPPALTSTTDPARRSR